MHRDFTPEKKRVIECLKVQKVVERTTKNKASLSFVITVSFH